MVAAECCCLERRPVIKDLVKEEVKSRKIYQRMCDVDGKKVTNVLNCLKNVEIVSKIRQARLPHNDEHI